MLFYTTTYIGDLHKRASPIPDTVCSLLVVFGLDLISEPQDEATRLLDDEATRLGTQAMFFYALVALIMNVVAPHFVVGAAPERSRTVASGFREVRGTTLRDRIRLPKMHLATLWALSHALFAICMEATL
jgi:solute carrier family 45 protein 1/2/4